MKRSGLESLTQFHNLKLNAKTISMKSRHTYISRKVTGFGQHRGGTPTEFQDLRVCEHLKGKYAQLLASNILRQGDHVKNEHSPPGGQLDNRQPENTNANNSAIRKLHSTARLATTVLPAPKDDDDDDDVELDGDGDGDDVHVPGICTRSAHDWPPLGVKPDCAPGLSTQKALHSPQSRT